MREIPIKQAKSMLKRLLKGKINQDLLLLTKKKDRSLKLVVDGKQVTIIEDGYVKSTTTYQLGDSRAKHELSTAFKREFPRSHQLYCRE